VIAIDRAGLVTNQADAPVGYHHFAKDIAEVFDNMKIEKPIVIAFASSNISLQLLLQSPEQQNNIRRAFLIDPDALTDFSSARYIEDAKPFKDNLDKYVEYILAGKYTERVKQKNAADREKVMSMLKQFKNVDWDYFNSLFKARLTLNNQVNLFKEIAVYNDDLNAVMKTKWPSNVPMTIFDTDFELEYAESAETDELRQSLIAWKEDAKGYYQSITARHPDSEYIETLSRSHLYQFEKPDELINTILAGKN
jgi:pimeloyl-ACP methyl ester carboxylesterase